MIMNLCMLATFAGLYAGLSGLCLSIERHYKQVLGKVPQPATQRLLYWAGWLLLVFSFACSLGGWGRVFGPVMWVAILTLNTALLVLLLSYRVKLVAVTGAASLLLSLVGLGVVLAGS